jgi:NTE family protein
MDHSPGFVFMDLLSRLLSPYQLNPANYNPIRGILEDLIDFDILRHASGIKLFACATNVRTGRPRVFTNRELDIDALLASACLPMLFQAVKVHDGHYWDGGYMGNPPIFPLIYDCRSSDVILVQVNPVCRDEVPGTAREILDRINEITFNSSLIHEMRAIQFVTRLIDSGRLDPTEYKRMYIHLIEGESELGSLTASTKLNPEPAFLAHLRELGRAAAERWLDSHFGDVGQRSSLDIVKTYLAV